MHGRRVNGGQLQMADLRTLSIKTPRKSGVHLLVKILRLSSGQSKVLYLLRNSDISTQRYLLLHQDIGYFRCIS